MSILDQPLGPYHLREILASKVEREYAFTKIKLLLEATKKPVCRVFQLDCHLNGTQDDPFIKSDEDGDGLIGGYRDVLRRSGPDLIRVHVPWGVSQKDAVRALKKITPWIERYPSIEELSGSDQACLQLYQAASSSREIPAQESANMMQGSTVERDSEAVRLMQQLVDRVNAPQPHEPHEPHEQYHLREILASKVEKEYGCTKIKLLLEAAIKPVCRVHQFDCFLKASQNDPVVYADEDGDAILSCYSDELRRSGPEVVRVHVPCEVNVKDAVRALKKITAWIESYPTIGGLKRLDEPYWYLQKEYLEEANLMQQIVDRVNAPSPTSEKKGGS